MSHAKKIILYTAVFIIGLFIVLVSLGAYIFYEAASPVTQHTIGAVTTNTNKDVIEY